MDVSFTFCQKKKTKKNRYQEALYTRLLLVDNTRRSKYFLKVVKMWIKEIRFYFSLFCYPAG